MILIPEIPYDIERVASSIAARRAAGSAFSIVAVAEGAYSKDDDRARSVILDQMVGAKGDKRKDMKRALEEIKLRPRTAALADALSEYTSLESRVTIFGHVQRGGTPSPTDRLLATRLGTACAGYIAEGVHGRDGRRPRGGNGGGPLEGDRGCDQDCPPRSSVARLGSPPPDRPRRLSSACLRSERQIGPGKADDLCRGE